MVVPARTGGFAGAHAGNQLKMPHDICYVLSFGLAARTVLHTSLMEELRARDLTVAVLCPGANEAHMQALAQEHALSCYGAPRIGGRVFDRYSFVRRYIHEDVRSNPALWSRHVRDCERTTRLHKRIRNHVLFAMNRLLCVSGMQAVLPRNVESCIYTSRAVRNVLTIADPRIVVSTYPVDPLEAVTLAEARRSGIGTVVQLLSWDNITCKGRFPVLADQYLSWGPIMTGELKDRYGLSGRRVRECGVAHFDAHVTGVSVEGRRKAFDKIGLKCGSEYLLVGMSSPYFAPGEIEIVEELARGVSGGLCGSSMCLVVRPHPQNVRGYLADESWLPRLRAIEGPRVKICWPEMHDSVMNWALSKDDMTVLVNVLAGAKVVLNSGSTFSIDALCHYKPVILTLFDGTAKVPWHRSARRLAEYFHIQKLIGTRGVRVVENYEGMWSCVRKCLSEGDADKEAVSAAIHLECGALDGRAAARIADALQDIVVNGKRGREGG